jgi:hypothetical protein
LSGNHNTPPHLRFQENNKKRHQMICVYNYEFVFVDIIFSKLGVGGDWVL